MTSVYERHSEDPANTLDASRRATSEEMVAAAIACARSGLRVIVTCWTDDDGICQVPHHDRCRQSDAVGAGKVALTSHGKDDATSDERVIGGWFRCWPRANIAVAVGGRTGVVVLDQAIAPAAPSASPSSRPRTRVSRPLGGPGPATGGTSGSGIPAST